MEDSKLRNYPAGIHRRDVLKSIAGIAAASALHPSLESLAQPSPEWANSIGRITPPPTL